MKEFTLKATCSEDYLDQALGLASQEAPFNIRRGDWEPTTEDFHSLIKTFTNRYIFSYRLDNSFHIRNGMPSAGILTHKDQILSTARLFRKTATDLMERLANRYNVNFQSGSGLYELRTNNDHINRINKLDEEWKFQFHGYECLLTNKNTGQSLDIIFIHRPEFGVLDPYFFLDFINTTPELSSLKTLFNDNGDFVAQALLTLEAFGEVERFPGDQSLFCARGLIAY